MSLLGRILRGDALPWSSGAAEFFIHHQAGEFTLPVAVRCRLGRLDIDAVALLDTGAQWSVLGGELAELLREDLEDLGESLELGTRLGRFTGALNRLDIILAADADLGRDLRIDATVLVVPDWPGPIVLGYRSLLERTRVALDPSVEGRPMIFFGPSE
jgi:hypothetical protein